MTRRERQLERAATSHAEARRAADEALARAAWDARSELPAMRIAERIGRSRRGLYDLWQRAGLMALLALTIGAIILGLATPAGAAILPVGTERPISCTEHTFFGGGEALRLTAMGATFTGEDDGTWQATRETWTYRRKQTWAAQVILFRDGRQIARNIGTRPLRLRCVSHSSAAHAVSR